MGHYLSDRTFKLLTKYSNGGEVEQTDIVEVNSLAQKSGFIKCDFPNSNKQIADLTPRGKRVLRLEEKVRT